MAYPEQLTPQQAKAIAALLTERTTAAAAKKARVAERTLARWLTTEEFKSALRLAQSEAISQAVTRLAGAAAGAVNLLATVIDDTAEKGSVRVAAARAVLTHGLQWIELTEVAKRLDDIERRLNEAQHNQAD